MVRKMVAFCLGGGDGIVGVQWYSSVAVEPSPTVGGCATDSKNFLRS